MGQIQHFTREQQLILDKIASNPFLANTFYFTGGTALSYFYLHHRISDDIDLFSETKFNPQEISSLIARWADELSFTFTARTNDTMFIYFLTFPNGIELKLDFVYYPYHRIEKGAHYHALPVDSFKDIAVNKIITVNQRDEVKDFVDLYFILKTHTIWDLLAGAEHKFKMPIDRVLLASDLLKSSYFTTLPKMLLPLEIEELKAVFADLATKLGQSSFE